MARIVSQPPALVWQDTQQALQQIYSYLFQMAEQLNVVLNDLSEDQFSALAKLQSKAQESERKGAVFPLPVPINKGGTNAESAKDARENLGIPMEFKKYTSISAGASKAFTVSNNTQFLMVSTGAAGGQNSPKGLWIGNVTGNGTTTISEVFRSSTNLSVSASSGTITVNNGTQYAAYVSFFVFDGSVT